MITQTWKTCKAYTVWNQLRGPKNGITKNFRIDRTVASGCEEHSAWFTVRNPEKGQAVKADVEARKKRSSKVHLMAMFHGENHDWPVDFTTISHYSEAAQWCLLLDKPMNCHELVRYIPHKPNIVNKFKGQLSYRSGPKNLI